MIYTGFTFDVVGLEAAAEERPVGAPGCSPSSCGVECRSEAVRMFKEVVS
jgi:hypothetical protein